MEHFLFKFLYLIYLIPFSNDSQFVKLAIYDHTVELRRTMVEKYLLWQLKWFFQTVLCFSDDNAIGTLTKNIWTFLLLCICKWTRSELFVFRPIAKSCDVKTMVFVSFNIGLIQTMPSHKGIEKELIEMLNRE